MLGKLLKHEWRSTWKLPTALCAFTVLMTLLGILSFKLPLWQKIVEARMTSFTFMDLMAIVILITYFIAIIISAYAIMIYFAIRYYKNLFTDEGYLMHTLPTTPRNLILSKTLISALWCFISSALMLVTMFLLLFVFIRTLAGEENWNLVSTELSKYLPEINDVFLKYGNISIAGSVILFVAILIVGSFSGMLTIYLCISIGQMFRKHKVAASIITYLVVTSLIQTVTSIAILPFSFKLTMNMYGLEPTFESASAMEMAFGPMASMMPLYYISLAGSIVTAVICFFVSEYLTKRKLNLD